MTNPTDASRLKQSRAKGGRAILATNQATGQTFRFEHVGEAVDALPQLNRAHVYNCLADRRASHEGFVFRFDPESRPVHVVPAQRSEGQSGPRSGSRAIVGIEAATGKEVRYEFVRGAEVDGFSASAIYLCLSGQGDSHKGYAWHYADGKPHRTASKSTSEHLKGFREAGGSRPIVGTNADGEVVHFEYIKQAADALGTQATNIGRSLRTGTTKAAGYLWTYAT